MHQHLLTLNTPGLSNEKIIINLYEIKKSAMVFRAINHRLRQQILQLIDEKNSVAVTYIYVTLKLEQSVASQHLGILRRAGIVITKRIGKQIYYSINANRIIEINKLVGQLASYLK